MAVTKENPFKEIEKPLKEVPPEMRKKIMADVATAKLIMDILSLFISNYPSIFDRVLKNRKKDN